MSGGRPDRELVDHLCEVLGIAHRVSHRPAELSGGQQQRVAVARALVARSAVVFADEPTGNLDSRAGAEVLTMLRRSVDDLGQSVVTVTHDPAAAGYADRVLTLADGRVVKDEHTAPSGWAAAPATDVIRRRRVAARRPGSCPPPGLVTDAGESSREMNLHRHVIVGDANQQADEVGYEVLRRCHHRRRMTGAAARAAALSPGMRPVTSAGFPPSRRALVQRPVDRTIVNTAPSGSATVASLPLDASRGGCSTCPPSSTTRAAASSVSATSK